MSCSSFVHTLTLGVSLLLLVATSCPAQSLKDREEQIFTVVEKQPEFMGGMDSLRNHLLKNVDYPPEAKKAGIKDRVFVSFTVETNGSITDVQVLRGLGYGCDNEAMRVIKAMPRWKPGSQSGREVRVKYNLAVPFGLDDTKPKRR